MGPKMRDQKEMTLYEHLMELRDRLKVVAIFYIASLLFWLVFPKNLTLGELGSIITGEYIPMITLVLEHAASMSHGLVKLIPGTLTSPLEIYFIAAALMALITSIPIIGYEFYMYVDPALYPHERRLIWGFMGAFLSLYAVGAFFSYFFVVPLIVRFMVIFARIIGIPPEQTFVTAGDYYMLVFSTVALMGLLFTSPAIFVLLVRFGLISTSTFTKNRLYVYGLLYILIAFITPDGWLVGNTVLFLPLVVLLEVAVIVAKRFEKARETGVYSVPRCKFCGGEVPEDSVFCSKCGRSQE
ncbi:MAG: twin-arginine translocase subunit TatC [Nitrososphaerota archaeon]